MKPVYRYVQTLEYIYNMYMLCTDIIVSIIMSS